MKSYTDLEQSKKLAEILPLESADMYYCYGMNIHTKGWSFDDTPTIIDNSNQIDVHADIPCWSLAALISLLPKRYCLETLDNGTYACYNFLSQYEKFGKTPIDAVYSMIVFLKEEKII